MSISRALLTHTPMPLRPLPVVGTSTSQARRIAGPELAGNHHAVTGAYGEAHDLPSWPRSRVARIARLLVQAPAFAALDLLAPAEVIGLEALEKIDGPVLFAANHTSHLDTPVLLKAMPHARGRRVAVAAAADYFFSNPWLGAAVALGFNAFPFARASCTGVRATMAGCGKLVESGWSILLYPEGTRSATGEQGPFKPGLGLLAVSLGVPVVPVCTQGLFPILSKGKLLPRPGKVVVRFGEPLIFTGDLHYRQAAQSIEDEVRKLAATTPTAKKSEKQRGDI